MAASVEQLSSIVPTMRQHWKKLVSMPMATMWALMTSYRSGPREAVRTAAFLTLMNKLELIVASQLSSRRRWIVPAVFTYEPTNCTGPDIAFPHTWWVGCERVISKDGETVARRTRPPNHLLQAISDSDFRLIASHCKEVALPDGRILFNAGDKVEFIHFPCAASLVSFVTLLYDGREVETLLVGNEGAVGGIVSRGHLPAYSRIVVRHGGSFVRLSIARLEAVKRKSETLSELFSRYADCLLAQSFQSTACNAAHSIEQRAAKWIIAIMDRTDRDLVPLTHDQLATMLGVGRSYTSRVIKSLKAESILDTRRGCFLVRDRAALRAKSCHCDEAIAQHIAEVLKYDRSLRFNG
jgi:CRP-like cAMP-binding protein